MNSRRTTLDYRYFIQLFPSETMRSYRLPNGFTLIEMSIVLVVIGLIVGGILVGQDLVRAAEVRAQITQIEKYNAAVNTFKSKFNAIPGDMPPTIAQQFGFVVGTACDGSTAHRDGNGLIDGLGSPYNIIQFKGETAFFWEDLSSPAGGNLIDGQFPNGGATFNCSGAPALFITQIAEYLPVARIGYGNYIYVYDNNSANWFGLSAVTSALSGGWMLSNANISVSQAYSIDNKIDDGLPNSGNIVAVYINNSNAFTSAAPNTATSGGNATSCYDTTTGTYSVSYNNGSGANCALSFKFN